MTNRAVTVYHGRRHQSAEVSSADGYLSGKSLRLHFGTGLDRSLYRVVVRWPAGGTQTFHDVPTDRFYRLIEGEPEPEPVFPDGWRENPLVGTKGTDGL